MAGTLETTFRIEGRETLKSAAGEISDREPGGPKLWGKLAGKFKLWGRAKLTPSGGDNGIGEVGMEAIDGQAALLWDRWLTGAGDGAGEALWTSSSLLWPVIVGCSGGFKQPLTEADGGGAKLVA
jgi:hypothetical protein